ncbi:MAG TPA: aldose 1-epimerase family protein [Streptosporangiaceae bacterium]|nr:aldose 1-epimerase family protein [Streptosporangiaceae bacterium]
MSEPVAVTGTAAAPATTPLTGSQYEICAGEYRATVTELGAGLRRLSYAEAALIRQYEADELPPAAAGQLLTPWPNRVDGGKYEFDGMSLQLELTEPARGNAIHGLTRWANWQFVAQSDAEVTLAHALHGRPGYPFCLELSVTYRLDSASGLQVAVTATNAGTRPAPYGTGCHPYLVTSAQFADDCELELPASYWLPTDDRGIPAGSVRDVTGSPLDFRNPRLIGSTGLDHAFTGLKRDESGRAWARLAGCGRKLGLWAGPGYDWIQVFTGDTLAPHQRRRAVAVEPMTCPPNAFATGAGRLTLAPADSVTHCWGIEVLHP